MGKYDELIKRLRDAEKMSEALAVLLPHSEGNATAKLYNEAADAIEELTVVVRAQKAVLEKFPKWISVTERLPEDGSDVLAYLKYADNSQIAAANYYKGTWQDCIMGRLYLTEEGFVTHWMPLPELPREE